MNDIQQFLDEFKAVPGWDTERTARTEKLLPLILENVEGDILEIGAHKGTTTKVFAKIAKEFGRHVYVIDPWDGRQQGDGTIYNLFRAATNEFDNITVHKFGSEEPAVFQVLRNKRFAYLLIDGLHSETAARHDFHTYGKLVTKGGIVCVDDWTGPYNFSKEIVAGIMSDLDGFRMLSCPPEFIERYLIKEV